jgi:RNA polymerase sigma factor (sigma-70 family)
MEIDLLQDTQAYLRCLARKRPAAPRLEEAWERFYGQYQPLVSSVARGHCPASADQDDCVQEVWAEIVGRLPDFIYDASRGRLSSWLTTLARRKVKDFRNRQGRHSARRLSSHVECISRRPISEPDCPSQRLEERDAVEQILVKLRGRVSEINCSVFRLHWIENRTFAEIATLLDLTSDQVRARNHRVKQTVKRFMEKEQLR